MIGSVRRTRSPARPATPRHRRGVSSCVVVPSPQISAPSTCHTVCFQFSAKIPECNVCKMSTVTVCGKVTPRVLEKWGFRCLAIVCSDCRQKVTRTGNLWTRSSKLPTLGNSLQSVVGPQVQLKEVFQKTPPVATACPVVVSKQRHKLQTWAAESTKTTISRVAQAVS